MNVKHASKVSIPKKIALSSLFIIAFVFASSAQTCPTVLTSKTGKVYSANPANITVTPSSNNITIKYKKTGGRAATQVSVYINNVQQVNKTKTLPNGTFTHSSWQTIQLNNVNGKQVKVQFVNQSVAHKFHYSLKIEGAKRSIAATGGPSDGKLAGQQNKTIYTNGSCTSKTQVIIRRTSGKARGNIRVWEKRGSSWVALSQFNKTFEKTDSSEIFTVNSNKKLKIELRNVSVGNLLGYRMNALAKN